MLSKDKITEYLLKNEALRYEHGKELQKTIRAAIIALAAFLAIVCCAYMYFVVPVEDEIAIADNSSQVVAHTTIGGDNANGR